MQAIKKCKDRLAGGCLELVQLEVVVIAWLKVCLLLRRQQPRGPRKSRIDGSLQDNVEFAFHAIDKTAGLLLKVPSDSEVACRQRQQQCLDGREHEVQYADGGPQIDDVAQVRL